MTVFENELSVYNPSVNLGQSLMNSQLRAFVKVPPRSDGHSVCNPVSDLSYEVSGMQD